MASDKRLYPELEGREDGRVRAGRESGARPQVGRRSKKAASSSEGGKLCHEGGCEAATLGKSPAGACILWQFLGADKARPHPPDHQLGGNSMCFCPRPSV